MSAAIGDRSFSTGGGGGTSTLCVITGVSATSSVSEDACCGGKRGEDGALWSCLGTVGGMSGNGGGTASGAGDGNRKFLLIVPLRTLPAASRALSSVSVADSFPSSSMGSIGRMTGWDGGEAAVRAGGGMDWRLEDLPVGELTWFAGEGSVAWDMD